jgi:hypothetical protein
MVGQCALMLVESRVWSRLSAWSRTRRGQVVNYNSRTKVTGGPRGELAVFSLHGTRGPSFALVYSLNEYAIFSYCVPAPEY